MITGGERGFTLIELLVVIGIIATLLGTALVALNPLDQLNRANDVVSNAISKDFSTAVNDYFANNKTFPWKKDLACQVELAKGPTLKDIPSCVQDITESQQLQKNVSAQSQSKDIYVSECNDAIALCYHPKSQLFGNTPDAKYTKNGALDPNCPNNGKQGECYTCTFSANDAQECFDALNPNGTLARSETPDPKKADPIPSRHAKNVCNNPASGEVGCMADIVTDSSGDPLSTINLPAGLGPLQLHTAYNLPCTPGGAVSANCATPATFGPQTIAVIEAYDAPNIENDLAAYDSAYGLPPCTKANGCLTVVNQNGTSLPLPAVNVNWAVETTLDVQMAHATCQTCKILLIEASSAYLSDMGAAVNRAAAMGATAISNSYGTSEWPGETEYNSYYNHAGTFITAASGDWGHMAEYPAASSNVIAVGGTTLSLFADNTYASESGWINSGLGCATYETANMFQMNLLNWFYTGCEKHRGIVDVSAVADPNTGVAIYMSPLSAGGWSVGGGWYIVGGTSVSSPIVAAALTMLGTPPATDPAAAYLYANQNMFRDITSAVSVDCGTSICIAGPGYDGPTGLGSPDFTQTIGPSPSPTPTPTLPEYPPPWKEAINLEGKRSDSISTTQFMEVPYNAKMDYPNTFTIEAWIKPEVPNFTTLTSYTYTIVNNTASLKMFIDPNGTNISYEYLFTANVHASTQCQPTGIYSSNVSPWYDNTYWKTVSPSEFNTWKHVAGVYQNGTFSIYENGIKLNAEYQGGTICNDNSNTLIGANDNHNAIQVGGYTSTPMIGDFFNGNIEDVRISNIARYTTNTFTPSNIPFTPDANTMMLYHFDNNTQDASGNGLNGIFWGDVKYVQSIPPSGISTPTPTHSSSSCSSLPVVTLNPNSTQNATVGITTTIPYTLNVTSTDPAGCSSTYKTNIGLPSSWGVTWNENGSLVSYPPPTLTLAGGETKSIPLTIYVPPYAGTGVGDYMFQIWVLEQGQPFTNLVNGYVQVMQATNPTPAFTPIPTPTLTPTPTPTPTPKPTNTPTPTPGPTSSGGQYPIGPYKLDDTKFLKTYAVLTFPTQSFPPNWDIDISFRPDFGGVVSTASIGYSVNGVQATADSDTILSVAYAGDGNFGTATSTSYAAQVKLTSKHVAFISMPYEWKQYANGCGKTIYWRVVGWPGDSSGLIGPTYTGTLDCTTKVGIIDSSLWWTYPTSDFNKDGVVDWTDYVIGSLWTKFRAGGWQPPE